MRVIVPEYTEDGSSGACILQSKGSRIESDTLRTALSSATLIRGLRLTAGH